MVVWDITVRGNHHQTWPSSDSSVGCAHNMCIHDTSKMHSLLPQHCTMYNVYALSTQERSAGTSLKKSLNFDDSNAHNYSQTPHSKLLAHIYMRQRLHSLLLSYIILEGCLRGFSECFLTFIMLWIHFEYKMISGALTFHGVQFCSAKHCVPHAIKSELIS